MSTRVSSGGSIARGRGDFSTRVFVTFRIWHGKPVIDRRAHPALASAEQITPSNEGEALSSSETRSSGKSAHAESYGNTDTENVDDHADEHHLERKRTFGCGGERQDNAIHEEIDGYTIQNS